MQQIHSSIRGEATKVDLPLELEASIELHHVHLLKIKVEALQLQIQYRRELQETNALPCSLLAMAFSLIGIVTFQDLHLGVILQGLLNVLQFLAPLTFDVELDVIKRFVSLGLVININALDEVLHFTLKQSLDGPIHRSALHLLFEPITKNSVQFLRVVLCEGVHCVPTKRLHQLPTVNHRIRRLQLVEDILQGLDEWRCLSFSIHIIGGL
mmetsp:Transcript_66753/g.159654  ORF Transcript_66753/g.159654 Transcript_66753/m.159654 type:complete len:211 (-) Transcript_66753:1090-1722(-)